MSDLAVCKARDGRTQLVFTRPARARAGEGVACGYRTRATEVVVSPTRCAATAGRARASTSLHDGEVAFSGEMLVFDPPSVMEFGWGPDDLVRIEVQPDGRGSVLTLTHTFDEYGKAARDGAGWHECLDLLGYCARRHVRAVEARAAVERINAEYVKAFPAEASTIGPPEGWSPD